MFYARRSHAKALSPVQRGLVIAAIMLSLAASSMFGTIFLLQPRAARADQLDTPAKRIARARQLDQAMAATDLPKILDLRERWSTWAYPHRDDLIAMLHASADGQTALMKVWAELPPRPALSVTGFDNTLLYSSANSIQLTWQPAAHFDDMSAIRLGAKALIFTQALLQKNFNDLRDIEISRSMRPRLFYVLYASGRVIERNYRDGSPASDAAWDSREIAPPYNFLK